MAACFTRGGNKVIVKRWLEGMKAPDLETVMVTVDCRLTRSRTAVSQSSEHPCEGALARFVDVIEMRRPTLNVNFFKKKNCCSVPACLCVLLVEFICAAVAAVATAAATTAAAAAASIVLCCLHN